MESLNALIQGMGLMHLGAGQAMLTTTRRSWR